MLHLALPFQYAICTGEVSKAKEWKSAESGFYTSKEDGGCTAFRGGKVQLMALDVDGKVDGVLETVSASQVLVIENHPSMAVFLTGSDCEVCRLDDYSFEQINLSETINEKYLLDSTLDELNEKFAEASTVQLTNFLKSPKSLSITETARIGPADYRSFEVLREADSVAKIMSSPSFRKYLENMTGLSLAAPLRPAYTRLLKAAGDYQILHGNYSEPAGVDCIFNYYPGKEDDFQWCEDVCGHIHYLDEEGTEILEISNASNSLSIVYRTEGVVRFLENVKGINNEPLLQVLVTFPVIDDEDPSE